MAASILLYVVRGDGVLCGDRVCGAIAYREGVRCGFTFEWMRVY